MHNGTLLTGIWDGGVRTTQSRLSKEIKHQLKLIFPLQTACLSAGSAVTCGRIIPEEVELLPALPLGDILAEELSENVPHGSMIVILKEHECKSAMNKSEISFQLGLIIGDLLLGIVGDGVFPMRYETEALRVMVNSYCSHIENLEKQQKKICSVSFHNGLSQSVSEYWGVSHQNNLSVGKIRENTLSEMPLFGRYLKVPNRHISKRESSPKRINLSEVNGKSHHCHSWKNNIVKAVMGEILSDTSQVYNH